MEYWKSVLKDPTGNKPADEFAVIIDSILKVVFSHTLKSLDWETASLAKGGLEEELLKLATGRKGHFNWKPRFDRILNTT